jgi:hypothetical protein
MLKKPTQINHWGKSNEIQGFPIKINLTEIKVQISSKRNIYRDSRDERDVFQNNTCLLSLFILFIPVNNIFLHLKVFIGKPCNEI